MDFAVLVKVVPAVEQFRFDPDRKTLIRTGVQSFLNPNDSRAVRVAVQLRRPGEQVAVLSMGIPDTEVQLREAFAFGVDRIVLLTDPLLAGSDTLVTARVLERALHEMGHDLVLAGDRSIDSETGQVGPEVAALLNVPALTSARRLDRTTGANEFEAVTETGTGWNRYRFAPPALVTVNERILRKAPKPTPAESARALAMTVERRGIRDLGLAAEAVGLEGSPTYVHAVENEEPARYPQVFEGGSVQLRVGQAVAAIKALLGAPAARPVSFPPLSSSLAAEREVLVLVSGPTGETDPTSFGVLSELRRGGSHIWPSALWVGRLPSELERANVARHGAARGYAIPSDGLPIGSRTVAKAMDQLLEQRPLLASMVVMTSPFGREVGGQFAARRGLGLTGDAVAFSADATGALTWRKPAFGGGLVASIRSRTRPDLATVRPGEFHPSQDPAAPPLPLQVLPQVSSDHGPDLVDSGQERDMHWGDLETARVVLIIGMGLGGPEHLPALEPTLSAWNAALGGTRRVIDEGWLPGGQQVGLTGTSVAADLAVLVGVSGAGNHLIGLRRTRVLVAVNPDPAAAVFRRVDVGIVGPWGEVLPVLTDRLAGVAQARTVASA